MIVSPLPPPDHGGIANWARVIRKDLDGRDDLEFFYVNMTNLYRGIPRMKTVSRLLFGSTFAVRIIYEVFRCMRVNHPDLLHLNSSGCFGTVRDIIILSMARMLKVPSVIHYHMQEPPSEVKGRVYWRFLRWAMSLADVVVILDKRSEARIRTALPRANVINLPNMVELDVIDAIARKQSSPPSTTSSVGAFKILFVGFIKAVKGVRELVMACSQLKDRNFVLDMVGNISDGALKLELEALANQSGKADWLRIHGGFDHAVVLQYMLAADLVVLPSHSESAPMVIIEAMGCGKPVVGTTTGAVAELLDIGGPQECGVCVPPRNVDALADAIQCLANSPQRRREFGLKARQRAEQLYSVPVSLEKLVDLWHLVADK